MICAINNNFINWYENNCYYSLNISFVFFKLYFSPHNESSLKVINFISMSYIIFI